jgi:hypothetical protein
MGKETFDAKIKRMFWRKLKKAAGKYSRGGKTVWAFRQERPLGVGLAIWAKPPCTPPPDYARPRVLLFTEENGQVVVRMCGPTLDDDKPTYWALDAADENWVREQHSAFWKKAG